jgi:Sugar (and other) transporter
MVGDPVESWPLEGAVDDPDVEVAAAVAIENDLAPVGREGRLSSTVRMGKKGLIRTRSSSTPEGLAVKIWQSPAVEHLAGPVFALVILFVRRTLPESPRWLITHGRQQEAEAALRQIEDLARRSGQSLTPVDDSSAILLVPDKEYG